MNALNEYSAKEYFDLLKEKKVTITDQELNRIYDNCLTLLNKYQTTGQTKAMRKLIFHLETIEKEREIIRLGINTFIYRDDIEEYIDEVAKNTVKIIELENYEREVPDDVVNRYEKVKDHFDKAYVLFTDYTGKVERQIQKERQEKDPILFGTFQDETSQTVIDRFYFIGDWEDEYCDLTLDKMVNEVHSEKGKTISFSIQTPQDIQELKEQLHSLQEQDGRFVATASSQKTQTKQTVFTKVLSFFGKKK